MVYSFSNENVLGANDGLVTKPTIARRYSVSTRMIDNWIRRRIIPYTKIGGIVRFRISETDAALARFQVK